MIKNYLKIAVRSLVRNKLHSFVNIFGLAAGIAASIIIFLFARNELTYDAFHEHAFSIYMVYKERITPTGTQITRDTWVPMAEALQNEYPAIKNAARVWDTGDWVQYGDKRFEENITYADPALFDLFTFPLAKGDRAAIFSDIHSAVISQEIAKKYFGGEDPIGKQITVNYETDYTVRGVLADIPENSTLQIDIMTPLESLPWYGEVLDNWGSSFLYTFIQLEEKSAPAALEEQFPPFIAKTWNEELNSSMNLKLLPLPELHNDLTGANIYAYILLIIAAVILVIASINFMNLTTARSLERAREIGMRKVLGATRQQLIRQFLSESLMMSVLALLLGIVLVELFLPSFNRLYEIALQVDYPGDILSLAALAGLAVTVGVFSGFYPAFVLSRFQPNESLRGQLKSAPANRGFRHAMVVIQFSLAIILIVGTGVMWQQIQFMKEANLNFDKENIAAIPVRLSDFANPEKAQMRLETFKDALRQHSGVKSVASSAHVPGRWSGWFTFAYPTDRDDSQRLRMRQTFVDANYFPTYGIEFVQGRNFSVDLATDAEESIIINEAALQDIGWHSAEGHQIRLGDQVYNVVGVVKNYHYESLASEVAPVIHRFRPPDNGVHRYVSVKLAPGNPTPVMEFIGKQWRQLDPGRAFDYVFVDENFNRLYESENRLAAVTGAFSVLAIVIACMGLFALASLMVTHRTKEIGIRRTLGATVANIVLLLTKSFALLVGIAFLIASPLAYYLSDYWLADFAYRVTIGWKIFALAGLAAFIIAVATVSVHTVRAALANPVDSLRYE